MISLLNLNFLSSDSRLQSFDARANGCAKGEEFSVVVLKRVADALRYGDTIREVIRGMSTNYDGQTVSAAKASAEAQARLITSTSADNKLDFP